MSDPATPPEQSAAPFEAPEDAVTPSVPETPAEAPPEPAAPTVVQPVRVDGTNRRSDDDALEGSFVVVIDGPYKDTVGSFQSVATYDPDTGYPQQILVRARDHNGPVDLISVPYDSVRPAAPYLGGR